MEQKLFSDMELAILKHSGKLTQPEFYLLENGANVTLSLLHKAHEIIQIARKPTVENFTSRTEHRLLVETVEKVMLRMFLMYEILKQKGLISDKEMADMNIATASDNPNKEATDGAAQPKAAVVRKSRRSKQPAPKKPKK